MNISNLLRRFTKFRVNFIQSKIHEHQISQKITPVNPYFLRGSLSFSFISSPSLTQHGAALVPKCSKDLRKRSASNWQSPRSARGRPTTPWSPSCQTTDVPAHAQSPQAPAVRKTINKSWNFPMTKTAKGLVSTSTHPVDWPRRGRGWILEHSRELLGYHQRNSWKLGIGWDHDLRYTLRQFVPWL